MPWIIEDEESGSKTLVVTGEWPDAAHEALSSGVADGLVLNYARGFAAESLEFIQSDWNLRRLSLLDRTVADLEPLGRLAPTLEKLSIQASDRARLDLYGFDRLRDLAGPWSLIAPTLGELPALEAMVTFEGFGEHDLRAFRDHLSLTRLTIKDARYLQTLDGIEALGLQMLCLQGVPRLQDVSAVAYGHETLVELWLEQARGLRHLDDMRRLVNLRHLHLGDCGPIESLRPLVEMRQLEQLYAWGTTEVMDGDLAPLLELPALREIRMRDRRHYRPPLDSFAQNAR